MAVEKYMLDGLVQGKNYFKLRIRKYGARSIGKELVRDTSPLSKKLEKLSGMGNKRKNTAVFVENGIVIDVDVPRR